MPTLDWLTSIPGETAQDINECKAGEMPDMREQLGEHANDCLVSETKKTGLFTFLVHNVVDSGFQIRSKPGRAQLS